jgi:hypothetical protein
VKLAGGTSDAHLLGAILGVPSPPPPPPSTSPPPLRLPRAITSSGTRVVDCLGGHGLSVQGHEVGGTRNAEFHPIRQVWTGSAFGAASNALPGWHARDRRRGVSLELSTTPAYSSGGLSRDGREGYKPDVATRPFRAIELPAAGGRGCRSSPRHRQLASGLGSSRNTRHVQFFCRLVVRAGPGLGPGWPLGEIVVNGPSSPTWSTNSRHVPAQSGLNLPFIRVAGQVPSRRADPMNVLPSM